MAPPRKTRYSMKKILTLAFLIITFAALLVISASAAEFNAAPGVALVDGVMDEAYKNSYEIDIDLVESGDGKTTGKAYILWSASDIYVFFDVTDPALSTAYTNSGNCYYTDSCEFFIDLSGVEGGGKTTQINAGQYTAPAAIKNAPSTWSGMGMHWDANKNNATFKSVLTATGYTIEMKIPFGKDYTPIVGKKIGIAFQINSDEDGKDGRDGMIWASTNDHSQNWNYTTNYDTLTLRPSCTSHTVVAVEAVVATCLDTGLTAGERCSTCDRILSGCEETPIDTTNHVGIETIAEVAATCTNSGTTAGEKCTSCGVKVSGIETVAALGHDIVNVDKVNATCQKKGTESGTSCTRCGTRFSGFDKIDKLEHTYADGKCSECGAVDPNPTPVTETEAEVSSGCSSMLGMGGTAAIVVAVVGTLGMSYITTKKRKN